MVIEIQNSFKIQSSVLHWGKRNNSFRKSSLVLKQIFQGVLKSCFFPYLKKKIKFQLLYACLSMKGATEPSLEEFVLATRAHTSEGTQPGLQGWAEFADWAVRKKISHKYLSNIHFCSNSHNKNHGSPIVIPVQQSTHFLKQKILN